MVDAVNNPEDPSAGTRQVPFSKVLYIEKDDFMEEPPKKFFRLSPGREVRLRYGYFITCTGVVKNDAGEIVELRCTYDPQTKGGASPDGRSPKATIHWVSAQHAVDLEVRLYEKLFNSENPGSGPDGDYLKDISSDSLKVQYCKGEPSLANVTAEEKYQFERIGYFCADKDTKAQKPVFNRTVSLKDEWAKIVKKSGS
jgi:glutaminyl-tRNA synthetase